MYHNQLETLFQHLPTLEKAKNEVISSWLAQEVVTSILKRHNIEPQLFKEYYASGVLGYFLDVIKGKQNIGACPVMEEFLNFLKGNNVHADELFILCSHFKKAMIDATYTHNINNQAVFSAISYLFDANFSSILKIYTDTIYQKEQVIAQSLTLLNAYKNAIDQAAIVSKTDTLGNITYVNKNFLDLCGYSKHELLGSTHKILRHEDMDDQFYATLWQTITAEEIFQGTVKNIKKNGLAYYIDLTIVPLTDPMQGIKEYISIAYDVTKLILAREKAHEASKAKEHFLSAMSHEIRTPLNAILGFVSVLREQIDTKLHAHYLDIIAHSGSHLLHLINDILDFSKITQGHITINNQSFDTYETFENLIELFSQSAYASRLTLDTEIAQNLPEYIKADKMRIQQVISNLISNAIKFTPQGGTVKVIIEHYNHHLIIKIIDNGIGITPDAQKDIFKPFIQAQNEHEGTGLGLAITTELVSAMQGTLTLESKENEGSCFIVTLPFEVASKACVTQTIETPNKETINFNAHVLVAEDNEDNRELIAILLSQLNITYVLVSNGKQAYYAYQKEHFDMIILDDEMPILKGYESAEKIRELEQSEQRAHTPIILLSANATKDVELRALEYGCDAFLTKPINKCMLQKLFMSYLHMPAALNQECLAQDLGLHKDELAHLLTIFAKNIVMHIEDLKKAVDENDINRIARVSHKIKGSASNFHFTKLIDLSSQLEVSAKANELINYHQLLMELIQEVKSLGFI